MTDPLRRYGHLRGFNYIPAGARTGVAMWRDYDRTQVERELDFAVRLRLNSVRVFLSYPVWEREPDAFNDRLRHLVAAARERGITTMPVLFDSCFTMHTPQFDSDDAFWLPNPGIERIGPDWWPRLEEYCRSVVGAVSDVEMWDVCNEPMANVWVMQAPPDEFPARRGVMEAFVRHFCGFVRSLDNGPVTVGSQDAAHVEQFAADVDVCCYHDYARTRASLQRSLQTAIDTAARYDKSLLLTELGCLARTNPYDMALEGYDAAGCGWYLWELMIDGSPWGSITGLVYADGTIRDAPAIAALHGFHRSRAPDRTRAVPDAEGAVRFVLREAETLLSTGEGDVHEIAERMANLLEASDLAPAIDLPSSMDLDSLDTVKVLAGMLRPWSLE